MAKTGDLVWVNDAMLLVEEIEISAGTGYNMADDDADRTGELIVGIHAKGRINRSEDEGRVMLVLPYEGMAQFIINLTQAHAVLEAHKDKED